MRFQPRFSHKPKGGGGKAGDIGGSGAAATPQDDEDDDDDGGGREGFEVIVCTQFAPADFKGFLSDALPLERLQPIKPQPSTVRLKYSHYAQDFPLEVGGAVLWSTIDEQYALSFVFKGDFKVRLVEAPPALKATPGRGRSWRDARSSADAGTADRRSVTMDTRGGGAFRGLKGGMTYVVEVEEDEQAEAAARSSSSGDGSASAKISAAALSKMKQQQQAMVTKPGAKAVPGRSDDGSTSTGKLIAEELRNLSVSEIAERSDRYKSLREAQDLQDVVFGGG